MAYLAYDLATHLAALIALPLLPLLLATRHREGLGERMGLISHAAARLQRPIWIHAASVGEVLSAQPLVIALRRRYPQRPILISTTSLTGRATARASLRPDATMLLPIDLRWIVARVLRRVQPACLMIVETELWPGLLRAAGLSGVPVMMVSGRVAVRSAEQYARMKFLTRVMLSHVGVFAMQTRQDADRIIDLGAAPNRVHVVGSLKYGREGETVSRRASPLKAWLQTRPLLVAASTHPGEEEFVLEACASLWESHSDLLVAIAPRRPERFEEVASWLQERCVRFERRSALQAGIRGDTQVVLIDTIGELLDVLSCARAAFVGGTIAAVGGHNVLEPALFAKPVAFGPHTENVDAAATALVEAEAAVRVQVPADLTRAWRDVLQDSARAEEAGKRAQRVLAAQADVTERTLALADALLSQSA